MKKTAEERNVQTSLIALSGPMTAGKSTLAKELHSSAGALIITTHGPLYARVRTKNPTRRELQDAGVSLDRETGGRWVLDHCRRELDKNPETTLAVLDCVRNETQLQHIRAEWPGPLLHLHLTASPETLAARYLKRGDPSPMSQSQGHPAEQGIAQLGERAPLAISASQVRPAQAARTALTAMAVMKALSDRLRTIKGFPAYPPEDQRPSGKNGHGP